MPTHVSVATRLLSVHSPILLCTAILLVVGRGLLAAEPENPAAAPSLEAVQKSVEEAALAGDNAWMLTSRALVLMMTGPGLALFYSGLVRKKNVLGVMMQCIFLMCLMTVIWALWGYSLAFGGARRALDRQRRVPVHEERAEPIWDGDAVVIPDGPALTDSRG